MIDITSKSGRRIIKVVPRALAKDGCGFWCSICKVDLGVVHGNPNLDAMSIKNAQKHFNIHVKERMNNFKCLTSEHPN